MEQFNQLDTPVVESAEGAEVATGAPSAGVSTKKLAKRAKAEKMTSLLQETIKEDPSFTSKLMTLSESIVVENTLGFGSAGGLVLNKAAGPKDKNDEEHKRDLASTSKIVGYRIKNVGTQPIPYKTEVFAKNAEGEYVGTEVEKVLEAGGTADMTTKNLVLMTSAPEISMVLGNGKIIRGPANAHSINEELSAYYFTFNDGTKVHGDTVKLNVGKKVVMPDQTTKWVVKTDFEATFGYLNNEETSKKKVKKSDVNVQVLHANYVRKLAEGMAKM